MIFSFEWSSFHKQINEILHSREQKRDIIGVIYRLLMLCYGYNSLFIQTMTLKSIAFHDIKDFPFLIRNVDSIFYFNGFLSNIPMANLIFIYRWPIKSVNSNIKLYPVNL
jgi:hypothetical protein